MYQKRSVGRERSDRSESSDGELLLSSEIDNHSNRLYHTGNDDEEVVVGRGMVDEGDQAVESESRYGVESEYGLEYGLDSVIRSRLMYHLTGPLVCNALYGLQGLQTDVPPVRRMLRALARELNATMPAKSSPTPSSISTPTVPTTPTTLSTTTTISSPAADTSSSSSDNRRSVSNRSGVMGVDTTAIIWPYVDAKVPHNHMTHDL